MIFSNLALFQLSKSKMAYLGQRQGILAMNVANVDTPGYTAQDVKQPDFKNIMSAASQYGPSMTRTHARHMQAPGSGGRFQTIDRMERDENNPDGNGVNVDTELQKVSFTQAEYDKVVSIYRKNLSFMRMAIGSQGGA